MGESEQEVYALMGISPLVYTKQESPDSKSVLVYVKKPGEELPTEAETISPEETVSSELNNKPKTKDKTTTDKSPTESVEATFEVDETAVESSTEPQPAEETPTKVRRRRRRRSSAAQEVEV